MSENAGSDATAPDLARDRYGRTSRFRSTSGSKGLDPKDRGLRIAFVVFLVLLVSGTVWIGLNQANREVTASIPTFKVTSDRTVEAQIEVRKDKGKTAVCVLRSRNEDGAEVGRKEVTIGPAGAKTVTVTEVLQTTDRPNTAELDGCRIV